MRNNGRSSKVSPVVRQMSGRLNLMTVTASHQKASVVHSAPPNPTISLIKAANPNRVASLPENRLRFRISYLEGLAGKHDQTVTMTVSNYRVG